jgi:Holliday junction resolvasome RuvABC endonuclease subunit
MIIVGIDPGNNGGIALLHGDRLIYADHLPIVGKTLSGHLLNNWFADIEPDTPAMVVVEQVHAMPRQGVTSTFNFGKAVGIIEGVIAARGLPVTYVTPQKWKKAMGVTADKNSSRQLAINLWPTEADLFRRVKDADRAEAALIAEYYRRTQ